MDPISAVIGGAFNMASAKQAQDFSSDMLDKNIAWQNQWRSTAHQTEVADLRAAGINPILTATGGKGAPMGSTGSASGGVDARVGDAFQSGLTQSSARKLQAQQFQTEHYRTETQRHEADHARSRAEEAEFEAAVARYMTRGPRTEGGNWGPGVAAEAERRMADAKAGSTAAGIERELDEASGELMRSLKRLGITGGSAAQILQLMNQRDRGARGPSNSRRR